MPACQRTCLALVVGTLMLSFTPATALAEWIDLGGKAPLTVELLESEGSRSRRQAGSSWISPETAPGESELEAHGSAYFQRCRLRSVKTFSSSSCSNLSSMISRMD